MDDIKNNAVPQMDDADDTLSFCDFSLYNDDYDNYSPSPRQYPDTRKASSSSSSTRISNLTLPQWAPSSTPSSSAAKRSPTMPPKTQSSPNWSRGTHEMASSSSKPTPLRGPTVSDQPSIWPYPRRSSPAHRPPGAAGTRAASPASIRWF
ncbi:hypothetical protein Pyn_11945 [Prunus yedoensis var. nudiflora]|uniref:Uncharacterized protein n=1 Tax=Prunus yedoensis var. nudiflora TaxID=2094558 RepID=A0A314XXX2_PRUYE|nr:hypothetical protein Pyn_11945 [Prunus yedoensis var. nudiflora]